MAAAPMNIGLFGLFGSGNLGNDGSLEAMLNFLRSARPDARVECICADPNTVERKFGIPAGHIGSLGTETIVSRLAKRFLVTRKLMQFANAFGNVRRFDLLIFPGTGILDDYGERFWGIPASIFGWCLAARMLGTKLAFVSIGAGPIDHPLSRWLMTGAARLAHYRSYRDDISREFMTKVGVDAPGDEVYPDLAFQLPCPAASRERGPNEPLTVGVGVMSYYGWRGDRRRGAVIYERYIDQITEFILRLLGRGYRVRLLMGENSDQQAIDDTLSALARKQPEFSRDRVVTSPAYSLQDVMAQIAETDLVVATRFHNIVCALKMNRPTISLGYAKKNDVLMAEMGLGEFCQHIEHLDLDVLAAQFDRLLGGREQYEKRVREGNAVFTHRLMQQERVLLDELL
jgi:polysaccharide pyruvyl transferase WcaK-like protein